jgi:serine/threonine-protein kinase
MASSQLPAADYPATQAGAILGTVTYMSPEQAQGHPADARSDIFSFGLVLYEMLSGRRAFPGESMPLIPAALLRDEPPLLQSSSSIERIVSRCISKLPSSRYQTMAEVKAALEQVFTEKASPTSAEPQPSIAVLPFADMSPGKDNEWFIDGLAEEIINALTRACSRDGDTA